MNAMGVKPGAGEALIPLLYEELRALAGALLRQEAVDHTLQPTALVHEAFLRLRDSESLEAGSHASFRSTAAVAMRRILVDHARQRLTSKRGGDRRRVPLDESCGSSDDGRIDVLALHEALDDLARIDERQARVVQLRFFGGFTEEEIAEELGVSLRTVEGDWQTARDWLRARLEFD